MKLAYVVDFDGTITCKDVTTVLAKRYAGEAGAEISERYRRGEIGMRGWLTGMARQLSAGSEQMLATAFEASAIAAGFDSFIHSAHDQGNPVYISSDGFGFYIKPILERAGHLSYIDGIYKNRLLFKNSAAGINVEIPHANRDCSICGNCKAALVVRLKKDGYRVIYIGNGLNDRYGASHADMIYARAGDRLAEFCSDQGMAFTPFEDFHDIVGFAEPLPPAGPNEPLCDP